MDRKFIIVTGKIPKDLPKTLKYYNSMLTKLKTLKSRNLQLNGFKKRCELIDKSKARNFEYYQAIGFDPPTLAKENKRLEDEIEGLKTEKQEYVLMNGHFKTEIVNLKNDMEWTELSTENLREIIEEKEKEMSLLKNFIISKGLFDCYQEYAEMKRDVPDRPAVLVANIRRKRRPPYGRLNLSQSLDTMYEDSDTEEADM